MAKVKATQSAYQIFEEIIVLAGSLARLGQSLASKKIQTSAHATSKLIHDNVDLADIGEQLSGAKESLSLVTDYAKNTDVRQMADDAGAFARKHPVATLVSVIAVGSLIAQMLRSDTVVPEPIVKRAKSTARKVKSKAPKAAAKARAKANGALREHA